jgi:hypothetical protein
MREIDTLTALDSYLEMLFNGSSRDGEESDSKPSDYGFLEEGFKQSFYNLGGIRLIYQFPNKLGASIIQGYGTYGNEGGLWELGVIEESEDGEWGLINDYTNDYDVVQGWLSVEDVNKLLVKIKNVPDRDRDVLKWINEDIVDSETILQITE